MAYSSSSGRGCRSEQGCEGPAVAGKDSVYIAVGMGNT